MIDTEILQDYSSEARELLDEMDNSLMRIEKEGSSPELLNNVFRAVHCIKGSAEYIGLERSSTLTHGVENLLDRVREGALKLTPRITDFLFRAKDLISVLIQEVSKQHEEKTEISAIMSELEKFISEPQEDEPELTRIIATEPGVADSVEPLQATESSEPADEETVRPVTPVTETPADSGPEEEQYFETFNYDIGKFEEEASDTGVPAEMTSPTELIEAAAAIVREGLEPEEWVQPPPEAPIPESEPTSEPTLDPRVTLEETVAQILNISLYLDDLQDGLNPSDALVSILSALEALKTSAERIEHAEILNILDDLSTRVSAIDPDLGPVTPEEIEDLRLILQDLRPFYPEDLFPAEATKGFRPSGAPAEVEEITPQQMLFLDELAKVPGLDRTVALAMVKAGFSNIEAFAQADWETLSGIPGLTPALAEVILISAGITRARAGEPPTTAEEGALASQKPVVPRAPAERSLLADVDDELLKAFEGIFGDTGTQATPAGAFGDRASEMLDEVGTIGEEADREIIEIFMSYGWEILDKLRPVVNRLREGTLDPADLDRCSELIKSIRSSSSYMDYQRLAAFLDEWYEKTLWASERFTSISTRDLSFMDESLLQFEDFLTGLETSLRPEAATREPPPKREPGIPERRLEPLPAQTLKPASEASTDNLSPVAQAAVAANIEKHLEESPTKELERALHRLEQARDLRLGSPDAEGKAVALTDRPETTAADIPLAADLSPESALVKTMRVDSAKVDTLLNQVGELVVNRSYVEQLSFELKNFQRSLVMGQHISKREIQAIKDLTLKVGEATLSLGRTATDLQEGVMKLRMLPVGQLFNRMPRLIRDLSRRVGKVVGLEVFGGDTEVDKRVIEQIYNPLVHLIRNAVDHGIEDAETRKKAGKRDEGTITLRAYSQGNQVVIDVEDDGSGIKTEAVLEKAVEHRLVEAQDSKGLSEQEVYNFLFVPGFSTSKKVTRTSGRGVGMDVVKKDVEKINGHIEVESWEDQGTRISIKIPLTLAIIQTLLVRVVRHVFAIPLTSVREIIQISPREIITIEGFEVIKFRDETIPVLRINEIFNMKVPEDSKSPRFLVLAIAGNKTVGLLVEELLGEQDVVIKPLAEHVCEIRGLAGSTILGDGTISLVLDVAEMIEDVIAQQRQLPSQSVRYARENDINGLDQTIKI